MIEYVDKLLKHWAQEMTVDEHYGFRGGYAGSSWPFAGRPKEEDLDSALWRSPAVETARGIQSRRAPGRGGVGKVAEAVDAAVIRLDANRRNVVMLHYRHPDKTVREKADLLQVSTKTFWKHIHKAHEELASALPDSYAQWSGSSPQCG